MYTFKKVVGLLLVIIGFLMLAFSFLQLIRGYRFSNLKDNFLWGILFIALGTITFPEDEIYEINENLDDLKERISKRNG